MRPDRANSRSKSSRRTDRSGGRARARGLPRPRAQVERNCFRCPAARAAFGRALEVNSLPSIRPVLGATDGAPPSLFRAMASGCRGCAAARIGRSAPALVDPQAPTAASRPVILEAEIPVPGCRRAGFRRTRVSQSQFGSRILPARIGQNSNCIDSRRGGIRRLPFRLPTAASAVTVVPGPGPLESPRCELGRYALHQARHALNQFQSHSSTSSAIAAAAMPRTVSVRREGRRVRGTVDARAGSGALGMSPDWRARRHPRAKSGAMFSLAKPRAQACGTTCASTAT